MWTSAGILILLSYATAHMDMTKPAPRRSKHMQGDKGGEIDYDMTSPLGGKFTFPCRGYPKGPVAPDAKYNAGDNIQVEIGGSAKHNGGHCWFAFSFDDVNFAVAKFVEKDCIIKQTGYQVPIPRNFPRGKVTFAWAWINNEGNDEYYMNCADIYVNSNSASDKYTGTELLVANVGSFQTIAKVTDPTNGLASVQAANKKSVTISKSGGMEVSPDYPHDRPNRPPKTSQYPTTKPPSGSNYPQHKPARRPQRPSYRPVRPPRRPTRPSYRPVRPPRHSTRPSYPIRKPSRDSSGRFPGSNRGNGRFGNPWRFPQHHHRHQHHRNHLNFGRGHRYMPPVPGSYPQYTKFPIWKPGRQSNAWVPPRSVYGRKYH